jgi:hypothetical protein
LAAESVLGVAAIVFTQDFGKLAFGQLRVREFFRILDIVASIQNEM